MHDRARDPIRQQSCVSNVVHVAITFFGTLILLTGCKTKPPAPAPQAEMEHPVNEAGTNQTISELQQPDHSLVLPLNFARRTGDLDEIIKARNIRALVVNSHTGFFYDKGQPHGIFYEALQEFQKFVNDKFKIGKLPVRVTFLPVRPDQLESGLTQGLGDIVATGILVTPERAQRVAFTTPIQSDVKLIVVTGPTFGPLTSLDGLSGKVIYVNPLTVAYEKLEQLSDNFKKTGKAPIQIKAADKTLMDEDLLEMVNSGLLPATVTTSDRAQFWTKVFDHITPHPDLSIATEGQLAWVLRKNNPQFKALLDQFIQEHSARTSFGNEELQRYLRDTKWVKDSTSTAEMAKFQSNIAFFKQYAGQYNFDYLMIAAQAYQESQLDQSKRNPSGAIGIMQVIPKYAAAPPISVPNVTAAQSNIEAGVKNVEQYF